MAEIRGIIFDFGKVICDFDLHVFLQEAARYSTKTHAELNSIMTSIKDVAVRYETGFMTSDEFIAFISAAASLRMPRETFVRAYTEIFTPIDSTFALVRHLKNSYRLGLLSNTSELHFEKGIKPVAIFPLFDAVTLSYEVHAMKPDRRIYDDALRKMGLPSEACVYIDDLPANVAAGAALGLHAIRYTTHDALVADLRRLGIVV